MSSYESLRNIANRLIRENICAIPLDEKSLNIIFEYMNYYSSNSDLCRRLADVENNYVQIFYDADNACSSAIESQKVLINICRNLTDEWYRKGYLQSYSFRSTENDDRDINLAYINAISTINNQLKVLSDSLLVLSETAAQIRACSSSFIEIYKESKLAIYAYTLTRNVESVLESRSTSLQAHASAKECERLSSKLMGNARACTKIINCINNMIFEVNQLLNIDIYDDSIGRKISPIKSSYSIMSTITTLENINIEKFNY